MAQPLRANASRTLTLLCFEQSRFFPNNTAHWALYLRDELSETGTLYHANKESLVTGKTFYERAPNINPMTTKSLRASVEVASAIGITDSALHFQCTQAAENRPFDLIVNNCQRFCSEILQGLVKTGTITQDQFDALATKGFQPLV